MHFGTVVKSGTFLYNGITECDLCIILSPIRYGTGDCDDPPHIANDTEEKTYYLYFGSTTERGKFNAGGGGYPSVEEAVAAAECAPGIGATVHWSE